MKIFTDNCRRMVEAAWRLSPAAWMLLLASGLSVGNLQATLTATPSSITLNCSTMTGPAAGVTVTVRPSTPIASGGSPIAVALGSLPGGVTVTPTTATLTNANQVAGVTFTVRSANGCAGASSGTNAVSFRFLANTVNNATVNISHVVVATASPLTATPSAVSISCIYNGSTYAPGPAQTVSVASAVTSLQGGTPFTVDTSASGSVGAAHPWVTVTPTTLQTPHSTASGSISIVATAGCGSFAVGTTNTTTVTLLNAPAPARVINVTMRVIPPTPLSALPASAVLTYVKGSGTAGRADVAISASTGTPFFSVDTTSLPIWLTVDAMTGTTPRTLRFSSTSVADTLAAGTYRATVRLRVANFGDLAIPVSLTVNNSAPRLSVSEGTTRNLTWTVGQPLPSLLITAVSSDSPIPYTITTGGNLAPIVATSQQSGLAYGFGTQIPVTFDPLVFAAATPGNTLIGNVTLTWGSPARTIVVTINVAIQSASATVTGISPASLPTGAPGTTFTLVLTGSEFIPSSDPGLRTRVGIVSAGNLVSNTNIQANVVNGSNIILTIVVPVAADPALPFSPLGAGGTVVIGVCNPFNGVCGSPTGSAVLSIGNNPIIQSVTSASSYQQVTPPTLQTVAPYDMLSIFGTNFCTSGGTGCGSSQVLYGIPDPLTVTYPQWISPDPAGATQRRTTVTFQTTGSSPTVIGTAPILFATNNQINVMVPAALSSYLNTDVDVVVNFGYATGATLRSSTPFTVRAVATSPGLFTIGSNGQGDGAILDSRFAVVGPTNPAAIRTNVAAASGGLSDTVQIYLTGLGSPIAGANNASTGTSGGAVWGTDCISVASYLTSLNASTGASLTTADGSVMLSSLLNTNRLVPCIQGSVANLPSVTIGGRPAVVSYAGFLPDGIAGLYQINAKLPINGAATLTDSAGNTITSVTAPVQLPIVVTANSRASQPGVNVWVTPRLSLTGPSGAGLSGTVGVPWVTSSNAVVASEGTLPYRYAITSGLLPAGLTFNTALGTITGTPNANTAGNYQVTVTATDSATTPVTGTISFTLSVAGGLFVTNSGTGPFLGTFGTPVTNVTTVSAIGGVFPYAYAITTPSSIPTGMTVGASSGVLGYTNLTPAGNYTVAVTATDTTVTTPLTGSASFAVNIALLMTPSVSATPTFGTAGPVRTITATGNTGSVTYATATSGFTVGSSTGVVSSTNGKAAGTYPVVVTATDGTAAPGAASAATGTITINDAIINLLLTPSSAATPSTGTAGPVRTVTATGGTGTITYATATAGFTVNSSTGVVSSTNGTAAGTYTVVVTASDSGLAANSTANATGSVSFSATVNP